MNMKHRRKYYIIAAMFFFMVSVCGFYVCYAITPAARMRPEITTSLLTQESVSLPSADSPSEKEGESVEEGKHKQDSSYRLVTRAGRTYCLSSKGKKVKGRFQKIKKKTRYFDKKGVMTYGWVKKNNEYYYFSRKNGVQVCDKKIDGIRIKAGRAQMTEAARKKLETMLTAGRIVKKITKSTDTKEQKLYKCFRYIMKFPYKRYRMLKPIYKHPGWEVTFANDIFKKSAGCCVSEASALAFLLRECGYKNVYVCHDTGHAWTELNGRVYDPLFAEAKGFNKYYGCTYRSFGLHPVGKRLIG